MGTKQSRAFKIDWLFNRIKSASDIERFVVEKTLIADFCISLASRRETALEILTSLEDSGRINRYFGEIRTTESLKPKPNIDEELNGALPQKSEKEDGN